MSNEIKTERVSAFAYLVHQPKASPSKVRKDLWSIARGKEKPEQGSQVLQRPKSTLTKIGYSAAVSLLLIPKVNTYVLKLFQKLWHAPKIPVEKPVNVPDKKILPVPEPLKQKPMEEEPPQQTLLPKQILPDQALPLDTPSQMPPLKQTLPPEQAQARQKLPSEISDNPTIQAALSPPIRVAECEMVRPYTGDLTLQEKEQMQANFVDDHTLHISLLLSPGIQFTVRRQDIFTAQAEVIVNAANTDLGGGGGIDGAIHREGGAVYAQAHKVLSKQHRANYKSGFATMIESGALDRKYAIHHVIVVAGPAGKSTPEKENELYSCYYNSLLLAANQKIKSIAFPSISTGLYSFPQDRAAAISLKAISDFTRQYPDSGIQTISIHFRGSENKSYLEKYLLAVK